MTDTGSNVIKDEVLDQLYPFQIEQIEEQFQKFIEQNNQSATHTIEYCPKCLEENPRLIKGGCTAQGRQMYRCTSCNRRFVEHTGSLTWYSHQDRSKWSKLIEMTADKRSLKDCADQLDVSVQTVFRMRHKLLDFVEESQAGKEIAGLCELDEKYFHECHKGLMTDQSEENYRNVLCMEKLRDDSGDDVPEIWGTIIDSEREAAVSAVRDYNRSQKTKRGISHDLVCVITGVERDHGSSVVKATNTAKPGINDVRTFAVSLKDESHVWLDAHPSYITVLEEKQCTYTVCSSGQPYTKVDHLNNINSFHNALGEWNRKYRGVSSIYINRYANLWSFLYDQRGMTLQEITLRVWGLLSMKQNYFRIRELQTKNIFAPEEVMEKRRGKKSLISIFNDVKNDPMSRQRALNLLCA